MVTTQRLLTIRQLLAKNSLKNVDCESNLWGNNDNSILTARSWMSLHLIFEAFIDINHVKPVVLFPEYYCDDTLAHLRDVAVIRYYKIQDNLNVDISYLTELIKNDGKIGFIVGVHFFGKEHDFNNIKMLCKINDVLFVEDAVHVTIPYGKIGRYGDFCIYSPWKTYGLYDGAVLVLSVDCKNQNMKSRDNLFKLLLEKADRWENANPIDVILWKGKKLLQRFVPNFNKKIVLSSIGDADRPNNTIHEKTQKISKFSKRLLCDIKREEIDKLLEKKVELAKSVVAYVERVYGVKQFFKDIRNPYSIVLDIPSVDIKEQIIKDMNRVGNITYEWPALPSDLPSDTNAYKIKSRLLCITLHDGISLRYLGKKLGYRRVYQFDIDKLMTIQPISQTNYKSFIEENLCSILQSDIYGDAKRDVQGWKKNNWMVCHGNQELAVFTVLTKYGIVNRINLGPVFKENVEDDVKLLIVQMIRKRFSGLHNILFFAPNLERTGNNINSLISVGFLYRNSYYKTGFIDISEEENTLRKNLNSKWRNCLGNAERRELVVKEVRNKVEFQKLLELHSEDKQNRDYTDSGDELTEYLFDNKSLIGLYIENNQSQIISFIFIAIHGCAATYFIGWSNEEGYKSNGSRLLLWKGIIKLKSKGIRYFDLGGIDNIHTKGVAEFKEGTGCKLFDYVGEYMTLR